MPIDPLEEYASGFAPGFTPQQGSTLAPGAQGGLPFGAGPPRPQAQPAPMPQLPAIPQPGRLTQLGGQVPQFQVPQFDVGQLLNQRLQQVQQYDPSQATWAEKGDYYRMLREIPTLTGVANIRSQDRQLQEKNLTELSRLPEEFHTKFTKDQQDAVKGTYAQFLKARGKLSNMDLPDELIDRLLTSKDLSASTASLFNDPIWKQDQPAIMQELNNTKTAAEYEAVMNRWQKKKQADALTLIQGHLPSVLTRMKASPANPLDMKLFQSDPEVKQVLDASPTVKEAFFKYVGDTKNSQALAALGLLTGEVVQEGQKEAAKIRAQGPQASTEVKDVLLGWLGPDGKPLTPATAATLPPGTPVIDALSGKPLQATGPSVLGLAKKVAVSNAMDIAAQQGFNAVIAKASAEADLPLIQVQGLDDALVVNKQSETPVDKLSTSLNNLKQGGGEKKFAVLKGKRAEAFQSAKQTEMMLGEFLDVVKVMSTKPGGNLVQALEWWAKTNLNLPNADAAVALDALKGQVLQMARAQQGSAQGLSNLDAKSVAGMLPTSSDGFQTGIKRIEMTAKLTRNAIKVQLGEYSTNSLLQDIENAKRDIAKSQGVDIYINDKGQEITIPRGQSHPGKGWRKK